MEDNYKLEGDVDVDSVYGGRTQRPTRLPTLSASC
jgi:hypothetical protein